MPNLWSQWCAACHGPALEGRYGPPLSGPRFLARWGGESGEALWRFIQARMPLGQVGVLKVQEIWPLVALILQANGVALTDPVPPLLAVTRLPKP